MRFGYKIKTEGSGTAISKSINQLLDKVQEKPEENLIETIAIRSMAKAVYTTSNVGSMGWLSAITPISPLPSGAIPT